MRFGSGSYDVRRSEGLNPSLLINGTGRRTISCTVTFLDGTEKQFIIDRNATGECLLEKVFAHLELVERDFFGLQFLCIVDTKDTQQKKWLDPQKSVRKQMMCPPYQLFFRVKFYVSDPSKLTEEYTRYHFFLQLRQDILEGKLKCAEGSLVLLASYAVQSELGDYNAEEHNEGYLDQFCFVSEQTPAFVKRVTELHKMHIGQSPAEAEFNFLDHAKRLDLYGVDQFEAKDGKGLPIMIGVNWFGMLVFHDEVKINEFQWANIMKISFKKKQFFVQVHNTTFDTVLVFTVCSSTSCKLLWKSCIEHHTFFRLIAPPTAPTKSLFNIGSKYRYSGRTEFQTMEEVRQRAREERAFQRSRSKGFLRATFSGAGSSCDSSRTFTSTTASPDISSRKFSRSQSWARRLLPGKRSCNLEPMSSTASSMLSAQTSDPASPTSDRYAITTTLPDRATPRTTMASTSTVCSTAPTTPVNNNGGKNFLSAMRTSSIASAYESDGYLNQQNYQNSTTLLGSLLNNNNSMKQNLNSYEQAAGFPDHSDSESSAPSLRRRPKETTFGVSEDESEEHSWTPATMQMVTGRQPGGRISIADAIRMFEGEACTSSASTAVHHRSPSNSMVQSSTIRKSIPNGYPNGFSTANRYNYSSNNNNSSPINGYSTQQSSALRSSMNSSRASPRLGHVTSSSPRSSLVSNSSHNSAGIGASPPCSRRSPQSNKSNSPVGEDSLVTVRMRPDLHGRFGFNVKGGADQNFPVVVSRVAPDSAADKCHPRLNEGDQVILINGRDVANMAHNEVVNFIRKFRDVSGGAELVLTIKPNVYRLGDELDEPEVSNYPESARVAESVPRSDKLSHSLRILGETLASGKIVQQFEQIYRKKVGMTMNDCRLPHNVNKNRYRDVCPYDSTRVHLTSSSNGDYINANYVNMEIPSSGIVNRYIACQGPLAQTTSDFWLMVWEQLCTTIVMLTTTVERGRVKCHQYWPRLYESQEYGRLIVTCLKERETANCCYREFSVKDWNTKEERRVTQMQYTAWPDHGVPDDPMHFIQFVDEVRRARAGSVDPIVVHCSAGIGRTGVLILMETAACLVEANEPVYPIDITKTMRDQRPMAIQTPCQYTFVCESILRAYNEGIITPLAEYQKR